MSVLETIRAYAEVADKELLNRFVDSAIDKAKKEVDTSKVARQASQKQVEWFEIIRERLVRLYRKMDVIISSRFFSSQFKFKFLARP